MRKHRLYRYSRQVHPAEHHPTLPMHPPAHHPALPMHPPAHHPALPMHHTQNVAHPRSREDAGAHRQSGEFERGIQQGIEMALNQQGRMMAEVKRDALAAAQSEPYFLLARKGGFDEGFSAGMQASQRASAPKDAQFTYTDVESARRRGFAEGKSARPSNIPNVDEASVRKKMIDEMLNGCHVISESNPNMAPGVKAVRHLIKKLA